MRRTAIAAVLLSACVAAVAARAGGLGMPVRPGTQYATGQETAPRVTVADLKRLVDTNGVIVLDVRSADAYRGGHIPGAVSLPFDTVEARAVEWTSATKPVVAYCS